MSIQNDVRAVGKNQTQCAVVFGLSFCKNTEEDPPRTTGDQIRYIECLGYDLPYFHAHTNYSIANPVPPPGIVVVVGAILSSGWRYSEQRLASRMCCRPRS